MTRRLGTLVAVLAVVSLVAACGATSSGRDGVGQPVAPQLTGPAVPTAAQAGHPNVVFVLTDDLSTDLVRFMPLSLIHI